MKIHIVAVGGLKESYWRDALAEYLKRLSRFAVTDVIEVAETREQSGSVAEIEQIKIKEGERLLTAARGILYVLDKGGEEPTSEGVAQMLSTAMSGGASEFSFIIGGSRGLSAEVLRRADKVLSFGKVTYPHQLMRVILAEQIYRAMTIINNVSYHK